MSTNKITTASSKGGGSGDGNKGSSAVRKASPHVSECLYEFLLSEILHWVESECETPPPSKNKSDDAAPAAATSNKDKEDLAILAAERAAAKIERLGFGVGFRLCERLAQNRPLATHSGSGGVGSGSGINSNNNTPAQQQLVETAQASHHLEAVKFLCKEFWTEVFRKQIDKLQTNHRGIFVLKDHQLRWLRRFPTEDERARVAAIKMLAFPCGLIRGALHNLGIQAVVSCDFLADGKTMSSCSFNIKIKV